MNVINIYIFEELYTNKNCEFLFNLYNDPEKIISIIKILFFSFPMQEW